MAEEELPVPAPLFSVTAKVDKEKVPLPEAHDPATGHGRWLYEGRLGEGGLATVYRAWDCKGNLGCVAVKVLKRHSKAHARHAFAMHRESQWSLERLHNPQNPRYSEKHASLFARYLEDHTGFADLGPEDFEERRKFFESPDFDWYKQRVTLPNKPYVVMELVKGETLQTAMPTMSRAEKREVILQCATALEYLERFSLIHRDFRGCNMHLIARENGKDQCQLKILDLGVMISAEAGMEENCNMAVQAFRRRGDTEEKRKRYDWLPWEVRDACDDLQGPVRNFNLPGHAFDAFSLGVLILHLLLGKTKARLILDTLKDHPEKMLDASSIGVPKHLLGGLLAEASKRPRPHEVFSQTTQLRLSSTADKEGQVATPSEVQAIVVKSRSRSASQVSHTTQVEPGSDDEEVELIVPEQGKVAGAQDENAHSSTNQASKEDTAQENTTASKPKASATEELKRKEDITSKEDIETKEHIADKEEPTDKEEPASKEGTAAKEDTTAKGAEGLDKEQMLQQKSKSRSRKRLRTKSRSRSNQPQNSRRRNKKHRSRSRRHNSRSRNKRNRGRSRRRYTKSRSRSRRRRSKGRRSKRRRSRSRRRRSKSRSRSRQRRSKSRSRSRQRRSKSRSRSRQRRSKSRSRSRQRRSKSRSRSRKPLSKSRSRSKRHHSKSQNRQKKESSMEKKQRLRRERVQASLPQLEEKVVPKEDVEKAEGVSSLSKQVAETGEKSQELKEVPTGPTIIEVEQVGQEAKQGTGEVPRGGVLELLRQQRTDEEVETRRKAEKQQEQQKREREEEQIQKAKQQQAQYQQLMQQQLLQQQIQQQMLVQQAEMIQQALAPPLPGFGMPMQAMQVAMSPAPVPVAQPAAVPGVTKKASAPPPPPMAPPMQVLQMPRP